MESVWGQFDTDNSGTLDKKETRAFVQKALANLGHTGFSNEVFDQLFSIIDKDNSGYLDRKEMFEFIKLFC